MVRSEIPKLLFSVVFVEMSPLKGIMYFANAKIGKMIKCNWFYVKMLQNIGGGFSSPLPNGITNTNNTPVNGEPPECNIKYHIYNSTN